MDENGRIAFYARVSSQRQAEEATIQSQIAALEYRIATDGYRVDAELRFLDEGWSGATLRRPALERLRDLVHVGGVERLYVHSPDRLARQFVHQAVLLDEFRQRQVEVVFLNQPLSEASPEGNLLLHMQGMIAEYEREKILERTRRGRRFNARQGKVSVLGRAPYGYRYISKHEGGGQARYDVVFDEARVVRNMFRWVGLEGLSLAATARRLTEQAVPTRTGRPRWSAATVHDMLLNPAYYGEAHWGKTRRQPRRPGRRPSRGRPEVPRQEKVAEQTPASEQEIIGVPALINKELFEAVRERLEENRRRQRAHQAGPRYLLSGLLVCGQCGSAYCARRGWRGDRHSVTYRCLGTDKFRHGGTTLCANAPVNGALENDVWADVCTLLRDPDRLQAELQRRQQPTPEGQADHEASRTTIVRLKRQLSRLLDMYETGYLEKAEFEARADRAQQRLAQEEQTCTEQAIAQQRQQEQQALLADFKRFAAQMTAGLERMDFTTKRTILGLLIKRIEVGEDRIQIIYKVNPRPFEQPPNNVLQHCWSHPAIPSG
jgi:site-specific DNA recombinase